MKNNSGSSSDGVILLSASQSKKSVAGIDIK